LNDVEFKEHLKQSVDIAKVVGEYVRLRKAGPSRYVGLCPFHTEKTPSFGVNVVHQFYKCFGCGKGGDVFSFIQEIEGVSFFEAMRNLAERYGIPLPKRAEYADPETRLRAAVFQMQEIAAQHFRDLLNGPAGVEARAYLEKRGVAPELAAHFGLGYAERGGRHLVHALESQGFSAEQIDASGLTGRREDGSLYERFRHRLMFPIHNEQGKVAAFGGRALDPNDNAKYLNSPETVIYKKSGVLYNLHRAKQEVRKQDRVILVEGYMDAIGVWAAGFHAVVAPCGTALTAEQIRAVKRHSHRIVVNFDPDGAGAAAAERSIHLLLDEGMHVRVMELDGGLDPDEYCKQRGADAYRERLETARTYFHWLAARARAKYDLRSAEGRVAAFQFVLPAVQKVPDKLERLATVNDLAAQMGVETGAVLESFRKAAVERREKTLAPAIEPVRPVEKILLNLLLNSEEARERFIPELLEMAAVEQFATRRIFQALFTIYRSGGAASFAELHARLDERDQSLLTSAVLADEYCEQALSIDQGMACIQQLERVDQETRRASLKARVKEAERAGNVGEAIRLAQELTQLERR
jgi:DNA primase